MNEIRLVCADREELARRILAARFHFLCWAAQFTSSAEGALDLIRAKIPEILVTEIQLEASNGYELIRAVRSDTCPDIARLPILVLSHMSQIDDREIAFRAGASEYLLKPFDLARLEDRIRALSGLPGGAATSTGNGV